MFKQHSLISYGLLALQFLFILQLSSSPTHASGIPTSHLSKRFLPISLSSSSIAKHKYSKHFPLENPSGGDNSFLNQAISLSKNNAWIVGTYSRHEDFTYHAVIRQWDGTNWNNILSPNYGVSNGLLGVTALNKDNIWAVGYSIYTRTDIYDPETSQPSQPLIEHWNGSVWKIVPGPHIAIPQGQQEGALLNKIAALATNDIWAVGTTSSTPLIEHWNGQQWSLIPNPALGTGNTGTLTGIAALSRNDIWAVGNIQRTNTPDKTLVEHWNGQTWQIVPSSNRQGDLEAITAINKNDIWIVGTSSHGSIIEHWNGYSWQAITGTQINEGLSGVAAFGKNDVWAVGSTTIEHWNGKVWQNVPYPALVSCTFSSIAVASGHTLWALGQTDDTGAKNANDNQSLIAYWNGKTWQSGYPFHYSFNSLTTLAPDNTWIIGYAASIGAYDRPIIEHWDGKDIQRVASPSVDSFDIVPLSISAVNKNDIWMVIGLWKGGSEQTLIEHWNGQNWKIVSSPAILNADISLLSSISAVSSNDVWAAGYRYSFTDTGSSSQPLVEHWNGKQWQIVSTPIPPGSLVSITAIASNDVWVTGQADVPGSLIIERWNGKQWQVSPSPGVSTDDAFQALSATSTSDIWAIGSTNKDPYVLVEHWDGKHWLNTPLPGANETYTLFGVTAITKNDVWIAGSLSYGALIEHWNGQGWHMTSLPAIGQISNSPLTAIASSSSTNVWALSNTFLLSYNGKLWKSIPFQLPALSL